MAIIKGSLKYGGDEESLSFNKIILEFSLPGFTYEQEDNLVTRVELQPTAKPVSLSLGSTKYEMLYPGESLVGEDSGLFLAWIQTAQDLTFSVDQFELKIPYSILGPDKVNIGQGYINALFFFDIRGTDTSNTANHLKMEIDLNLAKKLFIINEKVFSSLLAEVFPDISKDASISREYSLLMLICEMGRFSEELAERLPLTDEQLEHIVAKWQRHEFSISLDILKRISELFDDLTSFPIELEALSELKPAGSFWVNTDQGSYSRSDLDYYHIVAEARIRTGAESSQHRTWVVDWDVVSDNPILKPLPFKLTTVRPIIASSVEGTILVRVIGFDGTTLWRRTYEPDSNDLKKIEIVIDSYLPGRLESSQAGGPAKLRRIRGQVLSSDRSQSVGRLTVVLQAKEAEDSLWQIVSGGETGSSGHFSLKYPKGKFVAAQALVSASPDSTVDLDIVDSVAEDETISDSFLYLLTSSRSLPEDTTCPSGNVSRLPDHADLIGSDEYSQDLGGQCVNVTRPNRTLREYSYSAIVRTSDPDVASFTLERSSSPSNFNGRFGRWRKSKGENRRGSFLLTGGTQIERAPISLSNPVRWQDAPEAGDKLSFYQSVNVATGHILFFKAVFKADGYSLGDLVYSLPLAPGQKKQIVTYDVANRLEATEAQRLAQGERLSAELLDERIITDELGGGISETLSGQSSARTSGFSAGLGLGVSAGKFGGSLGVAGGYSKAGSSASQSGARNISQFFAEKLRQTLMQNAESYRELNASVVTTVKEGQEYAVTAEVVANHNHCHSVTMMFFEVLRHYAISQELYDVQECVFVPLLLTEFTQENISKWKDVLAANLLPIPSSTYLQPPWFTKYVRQHPLARAFDANERIKTDYIRVDYPEGSYAEDSITSISGEIRLRTRLPRPRTGYDRIMSLPVISKTITTQEVDWKRTEMSYIPHRGGDRPGTYYTTTEERVQEIADISDEVIKLDANFQNVPPAQAIRVMTFKPVTVSYSDGTSSTVDGFNNNPVDKRQWEAFANILGEFAGDNGVYDMMDYYFAGRLVSEWDSIFNQDIALLVFNKIVDSIKVDALNLDLTSMGRYTGGEHSMRLQISDGATSTRAALPTEMRLYSTSDAADQLREFATLIVENVRIQYTTAHFNGYIYNGYLGNDLLDGATFPTPLTERDKRDPRKEDEYIVEELFEHLNSNLEHYNKVLWRNLDSDRRYMLLDGFSIPVFDRLGHSIGSRSLASVIKNDLIAIVGNSLVFPVADGYHVSQTHIAESDDKTQPSLLEHYRPEREVDPYRLSVPTRGVYMESVMGKCDACEDVKKDSSQDWSRFGTEEPTAIAPVVTPTPARTDWKAIWAQFAQPLISIQTSREAPAPGAGLHGLSETLANAAVFRDLTGLAGNQENVIRTYLSNQENARAFAEMAKTMATQEHNTENSESIMQSLDDAREQGAISDNNYSELVRDHLGQQIDGGARRQAEERRESSSEPSLTNAAIDAVEQGRAVTAQRTGNNGTNETLQVGAASEETPIDPILYEVPLIPQPNETSCWAAAMSMIESYRRRRRGSELPSLSAQELAEEVGLDLDRPYVWADLEAAKDHFGFEDIEITGSVYPTADKWRRWLEFYGPLYVTVRGDPSHAIIVCGIRGNLTPSECWLDILDPYPPNSGNHIQKTVAELNEEFNDGELNYLAVYDQWRILYHPDLRWASVETTGEAQPRVSWMEGVPADMEAFRECIVTRAIQEYLYWHDNGPHDGSWWENDEDPHVVNRLTAYWSAVQYRRSLNPQEISRKISSQDAWSAAFISYIFSECGITNNNVWPLSALHYHYIQHAIHNSHPPRRVDNPFHGYNVIDNTPEIGDLVGRCGLYDPAQLPIVLTEITDEYLYKYEYNEYGPNTGDFRWNLRTVIRYEDIDHPLSRNSHVDIVVEKTDSYVLVIGGNVELETEQISHRTRDSEGIMRPQPGQIINRSAGVRKIYLDSNGKIDPTHRWEILKIPASNDPTNPWANLSRAEVMWTGPQTEYFVIIKIRTDPND